MVDTPSISARCSGECGQPFTPGDAWWYHSRLGVYVHPSCAQPGMLVCGEDISTQTITWETVPR